LPKDLDQQAHGVLIIFSVSILLGQSGWAIETFETDSLLHGQLGCPVSGRAARVRVRVKVRAAFFHCFLGCFSPWPAQTGAHRDNGEK
jgi:hypothetical protein